MKVAVLLGNMALATMASASAKDGVIRTGKEII